MTIQLRDYQDIVFGETRALVAKGERSVLIQMSTGAGKTAVGAHILKRAVERGAHTHFWVHRRELVRQSILAMDKAGVPCGIIAAGFPPNPTAPVQIGMIQSIGRRVDRIAPPNLIIVDECHHAASTTLSALINHYNDAVILGLTATPWRLDGSGLRPWFKNMVCGPTTSELIRMGWLSDYRLFGPTRPVDLSGVQVVAGDYNKKQLAERMKTSQVTGDAVKHYQDHIPGKRALAFLWSIEASIELAARFNAAGIPAVHVDGETPDAIRDMAMKAFADGTIKVLCNVDIVSEGFDVPACDAIFLLRPTKSLTLFLQQVGRGLRPSEGKQHCYIFDHANNVIGNHHGLPDDDREWSLDGRKKRAKSDDSDAPLHRMCPRCKEVSRLSVRICPCGYKLVMERELEIDKDANLAEVDRDAVRRERLAMQGQAQTLEALTAIGKRQGHRHPDLWAKHVLRAREEKRARIERERAARAAAINPPLASQSDAPRLWLDF